MQDWTSWNSTEQRKNHVSTEIRWHFHPLCHTNAIKGCQKLTFPLVSLHFCCPPRAHGSASLYYTHTSLALRDRGQLSPGGSMAPVLSGYCNGTKQLLACLQTHAHNWALPLSLPHLNSAVINILLNICRGTMSRFFPTLTYISIFSRAMRF